VRVYKHNPPLFRPPTPNPTIATPTTQQFSEAPPTTYTVPIQSQCDVIYNNKINSPNTPFFLLNPDMSQNAPSDGAPQGQINLASLSVPQLRALQTRLTSELEHLTTSHTKLRAAQAKFRDCVRSINDGVTGNEKKGTDGRNEILVPLTSSLYVKGRLTDREKVLVDVGTGFYVEKTAPKAIAFYDEKVKGLEANLQELEKIVQTKSSQLRVVEETLRQKMLAEGAPQAPAG
ncbi:Prefoldin, partial [Penicillium robsamsonii]|uniref:Prefoldin n=1 Tax=Penicillium robsamsonii TaxID=1792511 RepID=UPI00254816CB